MKSRSHQGILLLFIAALERWPRLHPGIVSDPKPRGQQRTKIRRNDWARLPYVFQMLGNFYAGLCATRQSSRAVQESSESLLARSILYLKRAVAVDPNNYTAYNDWGYWINYGENWEAIESLHQKSLAIFPQQQRALLNIADVLIKQDRFDEASDYLKRLLSATNASEWVAEKPGERYMPERTHLYWAFWASRQVRNAEFGDRMLEQCVQRLERALPVMADPDEKRDIWNLYLWLGTRVADGFGAPLEERIKDTGDDKLIARFEAVKQRGNGSLVP